MLDGLLKCFEELVLDLTGVGEHITGSHVGKQKEHGRAVVSGRGYRDDVSGGMSRRSPDGGDIGGLDRFERWHMRQRCRFITLRT